MMHHSDMQFSLLDCSWLGLHRKHTKVRFRRSSATDSYFVAEKGIKLERGVEMKERRGKGGLALSQRQKSQQP